MLLHQNHSHPSSSHQLLEPREEVKYFIFIERIKRGKLLPSTEYKIRLRNVFINGLYFAKTACKLYHVIK